MFKSALVMIAMTAFSALSFASENRLDTLPNGTYVTDANYCGFNVTVDAENLKIYVESTSNPWIGATCNEPYMSFVATCPDHSGQNCRFPGGQVINILPGAYQFILNHSEEATIYTHLIN